MALRSRVIMGMARPHASVINRVARVRSVYLDAHLNQACGQRSLRSRITQTMPPISEYWRNLRSLKTTL